MTVPEVVLFVSLIKNPVNLLLLQPTFSKRVEPVDEEALATMTGDVNVIGQAVP